MNEANMTTHNLQNLISGFMAGFVSTVALYPLDLLKLRMQVIESNQAISLKSSAISKSPISSSSTVKLSAIGDGAYDSMFTATRFILRQEGCIGLYRGIVPAVIASSGSWGGYFYFYEYFKHINSKELNRTTTKMDSSNSTVNLLSGFQAGACLVLIFNPLWLIKTRLTLQGTVPNARQYNGILDAFQTILKEEGFKGFYKGIVPSMLLTSHGAIQFAVYEKLKIIGKQFRLDNRVSVSTDGSLSQTPSMSVVNGGISKIVATFATYPYQVIKSRLQQGDSLISRSNNTTPSNGSAVTQIHSTCLKTSVCSLVPSSSSTSISRSVYDQLLLRRNTCNKPNHSNYDYRIQDKYKGTIDCARKILKYEGLAGFFRGVVPCCLRSAPSAGITFLVYEESLRYFQSNHLFELS